MADQLSAIAFWALLKGLHRDCIYIKIPMLLLKLILFVFSFQNKHSKTNDNYKSDADENYPPALPCSIMVGCSLRIITRCRNVSTLCIVAGC